MYYFAGDASDNPTFYADLRNPQSLNKYQYCYNNPLRYVDPDGHDPLDPDPQQQRTGSIPVPPPPLTIPPDQAEALARKVLEADAAVKGYMQSLPWFEAIREWGPFRKVREWIGTEPAPTPVPDITIPAQQQAQPQTTTPPQQRVQPMPPPAPMEARRSKGKENRGGKEHTKGARPSTRGPHDAGRARKKMDKGGEKGDKRRPFRRGGKKAGAATVEENN